MSSYSPFTIKPAAVSAMIRENNEKITERDVKRKHCYVMQLTFRTVYGSGQLPQSYVMKLPRLINGVPLGAGRLTQSQEEGILWKYVEQGGSAVGGDMHTFVSVPITEDEAERTRQALTRRLVKHAKALFGGITVKTNMAVSECLHYDSDIYINDIASPMDEGLHFHAD